MTSLCCANTIRFSSKSFIVKSLASAAADLELFFETWGDDKWITSPFSSFHLFRSIHFRQKNFEAFSSFVRIV
jgi:hypothetical protein